MTSTHGPATDGSDPTPRLRVGIASFAHVHAAGYTALLAARPDVEVLAADPDPAPDEGPRGQALADRLGVRLVADYAELLECCDAVVVCTETSRHRTVVEQAAAAGVPILCEKPLATTVVDAQAMLRACRDGGVMLMTAYPVRMHPDFTALRHQVRGGRIGRVLSATGTNNGQAPFGRRAWFADKTLAGGGALADHTVHLADLLGSVLDSPPVRVYAQTNSILHGTERPVATGGLDTGGLVVVHYADGTVATIDCSWSAPATYPTWGGLTLTLHGAGGSVTFDAFSERLELFDDTAGSVSLPDFGTDLDALLLDEFVGAVRAGRQGQPDGIAGLRTLAIVQAAYASATSGMPEPVPAEDLTY